MKKIFRTICLIILALSMCICAGCITYSNKTPAYTQAVAITVSPSQTAVVSEYYYTVSQNGRKGVVNELGQTVLPFEYSDISILYFENTPAAIFAVPAVIKTGSQQYTYLGKIYGLNGKLLYEGDCDNAYTIGGGLIEFRTAENKSGVISYGGEVVVPARYDTVYLCGDRLLATVANYNNSGTLDADVYDKNGGLQASGKLNFYTAYYDLIVISDDTGAKFGLVDISLKELVPPVWDEIYIADKGYCVVRSGEKFGVIDSRGKEILPAKYSYIDYRSDWSDTKSLYFTASAEDGVYLFDQSGKQIFFSDKFTYVYIENGKLIAQEQSGRYHYINTKGEDIIPPASSIYTDSSEFIISYNDQYSECYTVDGKKLPLPEAQFIGTVSPDRFIFLTRTTWLYGICDVNGSIIVPAEYKYLYQYQDKNGPVIFSKTGKSGKTSSGIIDTENGSIVMGGFDTLEYAGGSLFYARKGPTSGLVDINGSWIWRTSDYGTLMD